MVATQADYQDYFRPLSFARVYANDAGAPMPDSEKTLSAIELHRMKDSADQLLSSREEGGRLQELDLIVTDAAYKVLTCWNSGGRFWYLETDVTSSTACVPSTCTEEHIERNVARMFFEKIAPPGFTPEINLVRELFHWGDAAGLRHYWDGWLWQHFLAQDTGSAYRGHVHQHIRLQR